MLTEKGGKSIEQSDLFHIVMYSVVINMLQHSFYSQIRRSLHSFKLSGGLLGHFVGWFLTEDEDEPEEWGKLQRRRTTQRAGG